MSPDDPFLAQLIANQYRAVRFYSVFAISLMAFGVILVLLALLSRGRLIPEALQSMVTIGGGFVSSLSAFPIKEIITRKEKVKLLEAARASLGMIETPDSVESDNRKRIENLVWQAIEKTVIG
jgi:hypothetical protein